MPVIEEIPEAVKVATSLIPALRNVKFIRGLVVPLSNTGQFNETKALEAYENERKKEQEKRTKLKKENNKYVIKISDAMACVESSCFDASIMLAVGKAFLSAITSGFTGSQVTAGDILFQKIAKCMTDKKLQQKNLRRRGEFKSDHPFSEKLRIRKGKLHPHVP